MPEHDYMNASVPTWSFSRLKNFESCPYRVWLAACRKEKEPEKGDDHPLVRGTRIHKEAEDYVRGDNNALLDSLKKTPKEKFTPMFDALREQYAEGAVELEQDWGVTEDWEPCGWFDPETWGRIKLDVFVSESDGTHGHVVDYKTGRGRGSRVKYMEQIQLYALAAFMRYPDLETVRAELWFLDTGKIIFKNYNRTIVPFFLKNFGPRAHTLTDSVSFPPRPSRIACRYCPFGPNNGGTDVCEYGMEV